MTKQFFIIVSLLLFCSFAMAGNKTKVAIVPLNDEINAVSDSIAKGIVRGLEYYKATSKEKFSIIYPKKVAKVMRQNSISSQDLSDNKLLQKLGQLLKADIIACAEITEDSFILIRLIVVADGSYKIVGSNPFNSVVSVAPAVQDIFYREVYKTNNHCKNIGFVRSDVPIAVSNGLAGYWTFDDQTGKDFSEYENTSKIGSNEWVFKPKFTTKTPSGYGYACVENPLKVEEPLLNAAEWTVCMWVYFPKRSKYGTEILQESSMKDGIFQWGYSIDLRNQSLVEIEVDGRLEKTYDGKLMRKINFGASRTFYKDELAMIMFGEGWHHVTIQKTFRIEGVQDKNNSIKSIILFFVDGVSVAKIPVKVERQNVGSLSFGQRAIAYDNVRFYERLLKIEEIEEIYKTEQR